MTKNFFAFLYFNNYHNLLWRKDVKIDNDKKSTPLIQIGYETRFFKQKK